MSPTLPTDARAVLDFWFAPEGHPEHGRFRDLWFIKRDETDREIERRFGPLIEQAMQGGLSDWRETPQGALALILLLDQFTRNVYRGTVQSFAGDPRALLVAQHLVGDGGHAALPPLQRAFVYLPYEHAEDASLQAHCVALFTALAAEAPALDTMLDYAKRHAEVIRRFGRFPHRNAILGRASTPEEAAFLKEPGSSF